MTKMPCHITDGPQEPDDIRAPEEPDPDDAYDRYRQDCVDDGECITLGCFNPHLPNQIVCEECQIVDEDSMKPQIYTKIGQYTGKTLYSYDQAYWWSTPETAWRCYKKLTSKPYGA